MIGIENIQNAPERPEYAIALNAIKPILHDLPFKVVAVDGKPGSGKTTLCRFLAWRFNISLLETDLFLIRNQGAYVYRVQEIKAIIEHRRCADRPILVEGVVVRKILNQIDVNPDYNIHVICPQSLSRPLSEYNEYKQQYDPENSADLVLNIPAIE